MLVLLRLTPMSVLAAMTALPRLVDSVHPDWHIVPSPCGTKSSTRLARNLTN